MPDAGVRLLTSATTIRGRRLGFTQPAKSMEVGPYLELARAQLTETAFQAEMAAGQAMSLDQAIKYAQISLARARRATG